MNESTSDRMTFRDEDLMAYADDALPLPQAHAIRGAAAADPRLARRIAAFRASREGLAAAFAPTLTEPVPDRLLALFDADAVAAARDAQASATVPASSSSMRRRARVWPLALAASVLLTVLVSTLHRQVPTATLDATVVAALEHNASGVPQADGEPMTREVLPLSTVVAADGRYCRDYEVTDLAPATPASSRARACRGPSGWEAATTTVAQADAPVDAYVPASGSTPGAGRAVDPATEAALIAGGWVAR